MPPMKRRGNAVALRKESVDRNGLGFCYHRDDVPSLSARRAWIEILKNLRSADYVFASLSARRAWIEIAVQARCNQPQPSLSARRAWIEIIA